MGAVLSVALAIGVPLGISFGIGVSVGHDKTWYRSLKKPSWTPPDWVFGPAWTVLYSLMGVSSWMAWKNGAGWVPLTLYGVQLALNFAWTPLFFAKKDPGLALADIVGLLGVLGATIVEFRKVDPTAAYLLLPYLGWSTFATALTYNIWTNNAVEGDSVAPKLSPEEAKEEAKATVQDKLAAAGF
jgi:tryptophan-rich sensory protein